MAMQVEFLIDMQLGAVGDHGAGRVHGVLLKRCNGIRNIVNKSSIDLMAYFLHALGAFN